MKCLDCVVKRGIRHVKVGFKRMRRSFNKWVDEVEVNHRRQSEEKMYHERDDESLFI